MYTESLPESHQSFTSLGPILCYTLHGVEGTRLGGNANTKNEMEGEKWPRHIAPVATP